MAPSTQSKKQRGRAAHEGCSSGGKRDDRMQLVLGLVLERSGLGTATLSRIFPLLHQTSISFHHDLLGRGFCARTLSLCAALAGGNDYSRVGRLSQNVARRLVACTEDPAERAMLLDARAFLQRSTQWVPGSTAQWIQAAYQEPDASFLSHGAAATAEILGARLLHWVGKPQGRYAGLRTFDSRAPPEEGATCVGISRDGDFIVSGSANGDITIWNVETGAEVRTLRGHSCALSRVVYTPDGKRIVSVESDHTSDKPVKIWDVATGVEVRTLTLPLGELGIAGFSPDGKTVVIGSSYKMVIWDAETDTEVRTLTGLANAFANVSSLCISPDGARIVSGSDVGSTLDEVKMWDARTGAELRTLGSHVRGVFHVCFSPDGMHIASGSNAGDIKIWEAKTGAEVHKLNNHTRDITSVEFSPNGKRIVTSASDNTVKIWDVETGAEVSTLRGHAHGVQGACFTPDGTQIVSAAKDGLLKLWDAGSAAEDAEVRAPRGHSRDVLSLCFSPDGTRVVSGSVDGLVKIWVASTGVEVLSIRADSCNIASVNFSPDGTLVVSASLVHNLVKIWDVATGEQVRTLTGHWQGVPSVQFSPDGKRIVTGSWDALIKTWDVATGLEVRTFGHNCTGICVCIRTQGGDLNVNPACPGGGHSDGVISVGFSSDGKRIVSGSMDNTVKIWVAATGAAVRTIDHSEYVTSVGFLSWDGAKILSVSDDLVRIWDSDTGMLLRMMDGSIFSLVEGPLRRTSGCHILTASGDELLVFEVSEHGLSTEPDPASSYGGSSTNLEGLDEREEDDSGAMACFAAPGDISSLVCYGEVVCVGCRDGTLLLLQAPFLASDTARA